MADTAGTPHRSRYSFDDVDRAILRVLGREPRAALSDVGERVGVHERTVARRLDRMTGTGLVRFIAALVPEYLGEGITAELAIGCAPGHLGSLATALARRPDIRAVEVATGEPQVFAEIQAQDQGGLLVAVDEGIGALDGVRGVHISVVLDLFLTANDWAPHDPEPTLVRRAVSEGHPLPSAPALDALDRTLVALLERDARMPLTRLARELSVGETTARRRLARLMASHALHLRLLAEPAVLGYPVEARFRLAVRPGAIGEAVRGLAREPSVRHLVRTTGRDNILGYTSHASMDRLRAFEPRVLAGLSGVLAAETSLLLHTYKRAGATARM
ncbi:Lrp/AsnC family transcriptional regulator [Streptomyces sp. NBC_00304]|uniref:Lrp/AsnC family transcriptional regulator n=1 Tax=Streptomyces sp. NBC_00304 TaxID=2975706 RepID=UPI002E27B17A|nr:Lrp/AsnC family transcriptional regulator [Streptomyces sp. NBC_00304]